MSLFFSHYPVKTRIIIAECYWHLEGQMLALLRCRVCELQFLRTTTSHICNHKDLWAIQSELCAAVYLVSASPKCARSSPVVRCDSLRFWLLFVVKLLFFCSKMQRASWWGRRHNPFCPFNDGEWNSPFSVKEIMFSTVSTTCRAKRASRERKHSAKSRSQLQKNHW